MSFETMPKTNPFDVEPKEDVDTHPGEDSFEDDLRINQNNNGFMHKLRNGKLGTGKEVLVSQQVLDQLPSDDSDPAQHLDKMFPKKNPEEQTFRTTVGPSPEGYINSKGRFVRNDAQVARVNKDGTFTDEKFAPLSTQERAINKKTLLKRLIRKTREDKNRQN
jgi:hypothetical protein